MRLENGKQEESFEYLSKFYSDLKDQEEDFRNNNLTDLVLNYLKKGSILDVGCGVGFLLVKAKDRCSKIYGIEPNKRLTHLLCTDSGGAMKIFNIRAEELSKIDDSFDNITMIDVLEHIKDDDTQIGKIYEKLRPGGRFIIVVPANKYLYGIRDKNAGHYRRYAKNELIAKLRKHNFTIKKVRYWNMIGFFPYLQAEKISHRELSSDLRYSKDTGTYKDVLFDFLDLWFKHIENKINFHFGLSLIVIAEKNQ
jgi:2-polyprenyl-3-methyl-5-hydroxy-6-metoxy-1,4-benzoquinol methylase